MTCNRRHATNDKMWGRVRDDLFAMRDIGIFEILQRYKRRKMRFFPLRKRGSEGDFLFLIE